MQIVRWFLLSLIGLALTPLASADANQLRERCQRAAESFHVLLLHASSTLDLTSDGFRQEPYFFYFSGLGNSVGAALAIDGKSGESWLFPPTEPPFAKRGLQPEAKPGQESATQLGIQQVVDWSEL
jgi:hypothetical protein